MKGDKTSEKRNGLVDVYRMVGAIVIMINHSYHIDSIGEYPFNHGFYFVEMFFLLTGFLQLYIIEKIKKIAQTNLFLLLFLNQLNIHIIKLAISGGIHLLP